MGGRTPSVSPADEEIRAGVGGREEADPLRRQQQLPPRRSVPALRSQGEGFRIWDADGAEYIDFSMAFVALVAGHSHPVLANAMRERVSNGTIFGFESVDSGALPVDICSR